MQSNEYGWTEEQDAKLRKLHARGDMFFCEIAKEMGKRPAAVGWRARKLGLKAFNGNLRERRGEWNAKHRHLRGPVMKYFVTHSWDETKKRFKLTDKELKSLFTISYRLTQFKHLRKETRPHEAWSKDQLVFLLTHAGLRDRDWIAEHIGRGNRICIKERMQTLGVASRNMQGLTLSQYKEAFGKRPEFFIQTLAGPRRPSAAPTLWKIVPWVWLDQEIKAKRLKTAVEMRLFIQARAKFQEWIFGGNVLKKMKRICKENYNPKLNKGE